MDYRRMKDKIVLRIDRGEEVVQVITELCEKEKIGLASIVGLGAAERCVMGLYDVEAQEFNRTELNMPLEVTSIVGNITNKDGAVYQHTHITVADSTGKAYGGHLKECVISGTAEIFIDVIEGSVGRKLDDITGTGLQLFDF